MYTVSVCRQGEPLFVLDFDKPEITIGRGRDADIVLPHGTVSRRHARIMVRNGAFFVVDDGSSNGTYVLGQKIDTVHALENGQTVYCGIFSIDIRPVSQHSAPRFAEPMPPSPVSYTDRTNPRAQYPSAVDPTAQTYGPGDLNVNDLRAAMAARGQQAQPPSQSQAPPPEQSWRSSDPGYRSEPRQRADRSSDPGYRSEPSYRADRSSDPGYRSEPSYRADRSPDPGRRSEPSYRSEPPPAEEPQEDGYFPSAGSRNERSEPKQSEEPRGAVPNLDPEPMPANDAPRAAAPVRRSFGGIPAPQFDEVSGPSVLRGPGDS